MNFESIDRTNETGTPSETDEFEKLEFLPEQPAVERSAADDTSAIDFTPENDGVDEPPVSFSPDIAGDDVNAGFDPVPDPDLSASTPFELFGTSLFDDDDLDGFDTGDPDDDLEF